MHSLHSSFPFTGSLSVSLSIAGQVVVPFLYSTFQLLCIPPLPCQKVGFFPCQECVIWLWGPWNVSSPQGSFSVPYIFPFYFSVKISVYSCIFVCFLFLPQTVSICFLLWETVSSVNWCFKLRNKWSWGENIVLGGINHCHHLVL